MPMLVHISRSTIWRELSPRASLKLRAAGVTPALISRMVFCHRSRVAASTVPAVVCWWISCESMPNARMYLSPTSHWSTGFFTRSKWWK
ncbi:hypothetical protein D3C72_1841400 [compost metagenome]